jgi:hypothetical protein
MAHYAFSRPAVTSSVLDPKILLSTLSSNPQEMLLSSSLKVKKSKAIPVTGLGGL